MGFGVGDKLCCHQRPLGGFWWGEAANWGTFGKLLGAELSDRCFR